MDANALVFLSELLEAGSLSEAGRRLRMSRANVSYRLKQCEQTAGVQLVRRTTRRFEVTEMGARLLEHGRAIRDEVEAASDAVITFGRGLRGRVRLGLPSGYGQLVMAPWLIDLKLRHPGIVLDVIFGNRTEDFLRDGTDIAVRVMSEPPPNLVARDLGGIRYVACASSAYAELNGMPVVLDDLTGVPLIAPEVAGRRLRLTGYLEDARHELLLEPTLVSENFTFLRRAIVAGVGVGIVPDYVVAEDIAEGSLVTVLDKWRLSIFGARLYLLYLPDARRTRAASTVIEFILQSAATNAVSPHAE